MNYLGIDLGGTNIAAGVVTQDYQIIGRGKAKTTVPCSEEEMIGQLAAAAMAAVTDAKESIGNLAWIGIGCPGAINTDTGTVEFSANLFFQNFQLKNKLEEKLGKKVFIANDANAAAYGEFLAGALQGSKNSLAITLGTGVGCGIIMDGKIYSGSNFSAGEMGHMVIQMNGRQIGRAHV